MNKPLPNRQSIRLKTYDYSKPGYYFFTISTQNRENLFGEITVGAESISARSWESISAFKMELNDAGKMVLAVWNEIPKIYNAIQIDEFIIMPNHIHGIIHNVESDSISAHDSANRAEMDSAPTLGTVVQTFKRHTTIKYIKMVKQNIAPPFDRRIWQRNYWEHIVRDKNELIRIRDYIRNNPQKWEMDKLNPIKKGVGF